MKKIHAHIVKHGGKGDDMEAQELVKKVFNQLYNDGVRGYSVKTVTDILFAAAKLGYIKMPSNTEDYYHCCICGEIQSGIPQCGYCLVARTPAELGPICLTCHNTITETCHNTQPEGG